MVIHGMNGEPQSDTSMCVVKSLGGLGAQSIGCSTARLTLSESCGHKALTPRRGGHVQDADPEYLAASMNKARTTISDV